ncbi:MAG: hypothetical protein HQL29_02815 [Candidatus Omnitrophica bacterium]|nr:hypothetical protein [Candidatus Omnitrophota bacterium]
MNDKDLKNMLMGAVIGVITVEAIRETKPEVIENLKQGVKGVVNSIRIVYGEFEKRVKGIINK